MKKLVFYSLIVLLSITSCQRLFSPEDTKLSKEDLLTDGTWQGVISKIYDDNGNVIYSGSISDEEVEFHKNGSYVYRATGNYPFEDEGEWELRDNNQKIYFASGYLGIGSYEILQLDEENFIIKDAHHYYKYQKK